jgi:hypothetical protein
MLHSYIKKKHNSLKNRGYNYKYYCREYGDIYQKNPVINRVQFHQFSAWLLIARSIM